MSFINSVLGIIGFGIGVPIGLLLGFLIFIYFKPRDVKDPLMRPLQEFDTSTILELLPQLPLWVRNPDYERVDWLNKFIHDMWPYLDKAVCETIKSTMKPYFAEYTGKFQIKSIDFEILSLGTLRPVIGGLKVYESNENQLIFELPLRWAGNPNIILAAKLFSPKITVQLIDLQISAALRIVLRSLVPSFPCFSSIVVSLMEKVDFGLKVIGGDVMAIPGLYHFIQETISKQVARLYLWPQTLELPILDGSQIAVKKPVGILHVKVVRAWKLLKKDFLGTSDPYVQLIITGEMTAAKKTSVKMNNLDPVWNEDVKLTVKDPTSQVLELHLYDWEKVGAHDKLGMQVVHLNLLTPYKKKEFVLDLLHSTNPNDPRNKKSRGQIMVEMTFVPFLEDSKKFSRVLDPPRNSIKKTRNPAWNEEFQFVLEEAPLKDQIHIEILSRRRILGFTSKDLLGLVDINLVDVVFNGRINEKYHLINSKDGTIHVDIQWKVI